MQTPQLSDRWQLGNPYERYVGRWSRRVAPAFLDWLDVAPAQRWLDVGCGTGALCAAIVQHCEPTALTGAEPSAGFLEVARETLPVAVTLCQGGADTLPLPDASVDVVVSGLVLNFVPDPAAAPLDEGGGFPLCHPDALLAQFDEAGLRDAEVTAIEILKRFAGFQDYWEPSLGGQAPAPAYAMSLPQSARDRLKDQLKEALPLDADGGISLVARARAVRATV